MSIELVLDEQLGFTDALAACRICDRRYVLEMLDWLPEEPRRRLYRVSAMGEAQARSWLRDLQRGSCDLNRAGAERDHMLASADRLRYALAVDLAGPVVMAVVPLSGREPVAGWRELPCDGGWFAALGVGQPAGDA